MELKLWKNFKKRINSTKQPADADATVMDVRFKDDTSIENPSLLIKGIDLDYNYCKLGNHYYYINDIVVVNNDIMQLNCIQDVLATYKADILSTSAYIQYSGNHRNQWLIDNRLTTTGDIVVNANHASIWSDTSGTVILGIAGLGAQVGFISYYALTGLSTVTDLAEWLYASDMISEIGKIFTNPYESIIEAHWVPWNSGIYSNLTNITFGNKSSNIEAYSIAHATAPAKNSVTIDIPWRYGDWRDLAPNTYMELYLPFYGVVPIDQNRLIGQTTITVDYRRDAITGEVNYYVHCGNMKLFYKVNTAVSLPVAQASGKQFEGATQFVTGLSQMSKAATDALLGNPLGLASAASGITNIIGGVATTFSESISVNGGQGSFASAMQVIGDPVRERDNSDIRLTSYSHNYNTTPESLATLHGYPYNQMDVIGNQSGYCQCGGASINISSLGSDKEVVNQWLNQGFYIE